MIQSASPLDLKSNHHRAENNTNSKETVMELVVVLPDFYYNRVALTIYAEFLYTGNTALELQASDNASAI